MTFALVQMCLFISCTHPHIKHRDMMGALHHVFLNAIMFSLCCLGRKKWERSSVVVFALLMGCQVIYLWMTLLEQPPCAVCDFSPSFFWSHVAEWCNTLSSRVCPGLPRAIFILAWSPGGLEVGVTHGAGVSCSIHSRRPTAASTCRPTRTLQLRGAPSSYIFSLHWSLSEPRGQQAAGPLMEGG